MFVHVVKQSIPRRPFATLCTLLGLVLLAAGCGGKSKTGGEPEKTGKSDGGKVAAVQNPATTRLGKDESTRISVYTIEDGFYVFVDGEPARDEKEQLLTTPCAVVAHRGDRTITIAKSGFQDGSQTVKATGPAAEAVFAEVYPAGENDPGGILASAYFSAEVNVPIPLISLNSTGQEIDPFVSADGRTIYFVRRDLGVKGVFWASRETPYHYFDRPRLLELSRGYDLPASPSLTGDSLAIVYAIPSTGKVMALKRDNPLGDFTKKEVLASRTGTGAIWESAQVVAKGLALYVAERSKGELKCKAAVRKEAVVKFDPLKAFDLPGAYPCMSADGLRQYVFDGQILNRCRRGSIHDPFGPRELVANVKLDNYRPTRSRRSFFVSDDEQWLFYESSGDLYMVRLFNGKSWGRTPRGEKISPKLPAGVSYKIVKQDIVPGVKRSLTVRLPKRLSAKVLRSIAVQIKNSDPRRFDRTFITYLLPGMPSGAGAWATSHFNPSLEVKILGLSDDDETALKQQKDVPGRDTVGSWLDDRVLVGTRVTIFREGDKFFMIQNRPTGEAFGKRELVESKSPLGRRFVEKGGTATGDHWIVDSDGGLQLRDNDGLIATATILAFAGTTVVKPKVDPVDPRTLPLPYDAFRKQFIALLDERKYGEAEKLLDNADADPKLAKDRKLLEWDREDFDNIAAFWKEVRGVLAAQKPGNKIDVDGAKVDFVSFEDGVVTATLSGQEFTRKLDVLKPFSLVSIVENVGKKKTDAGSQLRAATFLHYDSPGIRRSVAARTRGAGAAGAEFLERLAARHVSQARHEFARDNAGKGLVRARRIIERYPQSKAVADAKQIIETAYKLTKWNPRGPNWKVTDGAYTATGRSRGSNAMSPRELGNFELRLEWKSDTPNGQGGVFFRYPGTGDPLVNAFKIQLSDDAGVKPDNFCTGSLFKHEAPQLNAVKPQGQWNTLRMTMIGDKLNLWINDKLVLDTTPLAENVTLLPKGYVGLDGGLGGITYRRTLLVELPQETRPAKKP